MSIKEIDNADTTVNATRDIIYTIHKYILTKTSNTFQINQQQARGTDKYDNAHTQAVALEFSRK